MGEKIETCLIITTEANEVLLSRIFRAALKPNNKINKKDNKKACLTKDRLKIKKNYEMNKRIPQFSCSINYTP